MPLNVANEIDIILLNENELQVRYNRENKKNISIKGDEACDLYDYLAGIRSQKLIPESNRDFLEFCTENQILVLYKKRTTDLSFNCFVPIKLQENKYSLRINSNVFLIDAENDDSLVKQITRIAKAQIPKEDRYLFEKILYSPFEVKISPACINIQKLEILSLWDQVKSNSVNEYLHLQFNTDKLLTIKRHNLTSLDLNTDSYWAPYINWALNKEIVTSISPENVTVQSSGKQYIPHGYNAAFLLPELNTDKYQFCFGTGDTKEEAIGKACLEAVERFFSQSVSHSIMSSISNISNERQHYLGPHVFTQYLPIQKKELQIDSLTDCEFEWSAVQTWTGGEVLVPSSVCHYGQYKSQFEKSYFFGQNSNGCAAHNSYENAVFTGVKECLERDAILLWWYNRLSPPQISISSLDNRYHTFLSESEVMEYDIKLLNLTLDSLPIVMFVARHKDGGFPYFLCGASCSENIHDAIEKAFSEFYLAFANWYGSNPQEIPAKEDIKTPLDHELYYLTPENKEVISFLFEGKETDIPSSKVGKKENEILQDLTDRYGDILICDLFSEKINEETSLYVTKTIVPNLIPMTFGYLADPLAHKRIYDLPISLGLRTEAITNEELIKNYKPHFFP